MMVLDQKCLPFWSVWLYTFTVNMGHCGSWETVDLGISGGAGNGGGP